MMTAPDHGAPRSDPSDALRAAGLRVTPQRQLVLETLRAASGRHLTAEQVWQAVHERYSALNRSTVYRILELLTRQQLVTQTMLGSAVVHYELADAPGHHHLVCTSCRKVVELPGADVSTLRKRIFEKHGFRLGQGDLTLEGVCVDCATT